MDIQAYISSGVIESYVLGLDLVNERQELETLAAGHPEIKQAIKAFEEALEKQAIANAILPPPMLKEQVMTALLQEGMLEKDQNMDTEKKGGAKVISLTAAPKGVKWLRGAIAASVILLLGSAILNFYFYSQYKKLLVQQSTVLAKNEVLQASYNMFKDTSVKQVQMVSPDAAHAGSFATVLWNSNNRDVYLMVNNLPKHPDDKQYQLWAIVDGKPVDAGMLNMDKAEGLLHMKNITGNVQAFAITLEKKGGNRTPSMDQMFVVGKI